MEYIYLLREREFIRLQEETYKIGRTSQDPNRRMVKYPKDSEIILIIAVRKSVEIETKLIRLFKKRFIHRPEYGNEYFSGDANEMIEVIFANCVNNIYRRKSLCDRLLKSCCYI